jgi:hypothetical protein
MRRFGVLYCSALHYSHGNMALCGNHSVLGKWANETRYQTRSVSHVMTDTKRPCIVCQSFRLLSYSVLVHRFGIIMINQINVITFH